MAVKQENCGLRGQQYAADVSAFNPHTLFSLNFGIFDHGWRRQPGAQQSTPFENVFLSSSNVATVGETVGETVGWSFWHALGGGVKGEPERQGENISTKGTGQLKTFFRELPVKTWSLRGCKDDFIIGQTWCGSGDKWLLVLSDVSPEGFISDLFLFSEALLFSLWRSPPPGCELPSLPLVIAVFLRTLREKIRGLQLINHSQNCVKGFVLNLNFFKLTLTQLSLTHATFALFLLDLQQNILKPDRTLG